ncbi:MAG: VCBS repeat-containing protein [SAR324 cluster bacterium]|nr:VCBS repeat-containing protein [SAR324 cluster bacterium]
MIGNLNRIAIAFLLFGALSAGSAGAEGFSRYALTLEHEFGAVYHFDLTGNGMEELVVIVVDRSERVSRMYVSVYLHTGDGFQPAGPPLPVPSSLALAGVGRFGEAPGLALLLPEWVEVWPWRDGAFHPEERRTYRVDSAFPVEASEVIRDVEWIVDLNGDGSHEILVPRFDGLELVQMRPSGMLSGMGLLRIRPRTRYWRGLTYRAVAHDLPTSFFVDVDGNGWKDVIAFSDDQLYIFLMDGAYRTDEPAPYIAQDLQPPVPFDPEAPYDPPLRLVRAEDLNGDGLLDLVVSKNAPTASDFEATSSTLIYYGRRNGRGELAPYPEQPDQVFVSEGFALPILVDLDGNGSTDLIQVNVEVTFWNAVRAVITKTVKAEAAYYLMTDEGRYPVSPDELESYSVNFSLTRFGHQPIAKWGDLNGDGLPDLLLSADRQELGIHWGREGEFWDDDEDELIEDFIPILQTRFIVTDLNGDRRHDLLLTYIRDDNRQMPETVNTLTVLISRFGQPEPEDSAGEGSTASRSTRGQ